MNDFEPKFYLMDSKTEDLLPDGFQLLDGMKVMIEGSNFRVDVSRKMNDWQRDRALMNNRWCTVRDLVVLGNPESVRFTAVYDDGSKMIRQEYVGTAWFVKKNSMFVNDIERLPKQHEEVLELVKQAMGRSIKVNLLDLSKAKKAEALTSNALETTRKIMDLFQ